jgi:hypothetical protein
MPSLAQLCAQFYILSTQPINRRPRLCLHEFEFAAPFVAQVRDDTAKSLAQSVGYKNAWSEVETWGAVIHAAGASIG